MISYNTNISLDIWFLYIWIHDFRLWITWLYVVILSSFFSPLPWGYLRSIKKEHSFSDELLLFCNGDLCLFSHLYAAGFDFISAHFYENMSLSCRGFKDILSECSGSCGLNLLMFRRCGFVNHLKISPCAGVGWCPLIGLNNRLDF